MPKKQDKQNGIEAFAAFDDRMNLLYATIRPTREGAEEMMFRFNPCIDEESYHLRIHPIHITIDQGKQHDLFVGDK